nr:MAG TPA: hypothetical protein [Microviridae sp.]
MVNKKINAVQFLTASVVIDGQLFHYGVRTGSVQAFIDDVCRRASCFFDAPYEVRFTGTFYLDKRNLTSCRPWYPLF